MVLFNNGERESVISRYSLQRIRKVSILALLLLICSVAVAKSVPTLFAHRGCWSKNDKGEFIVPENSVAAVAMAARFGYAGIECDVKKTKDGHLVVLHDKTINRTLRNASDYSKVEDKIHLSDLTFDQVRSNYVLESAKPELRTAIPTLEEILIECRRQGIIPMLHSSVPESYRMAQDMFGDNWICFTTEMELLKQVREYSNCTILYAVSDGTAEEHISALQLLGGRCGVSTMKHRIYTPQYCKALTDKGYIVQASIFKSPREVVAQRNGVTYQLTDFSIMPSSKPYSKWVANDRKIAQNGTYSWPERKECGAVLVDITYSGTIEVQINDRTYTLTRKTMGRDLIGNRFFDLAPKVTVKALSDAKIRKSKSTVYEY